MSCPFHIIGALQFASEATLKKGRVALAAAAKEHDGVYIAREVLPIGLTLAIDHSGSMPASLWEASLLVLEAAAAFATSGQIGCTLFVGEERDVSQVGARRGARKKAPPGTPPPMPSDSEIAGRCAPSDFLWRHFVASHPDESERGHLLWDALREAPWRGRGYARVLESLVASSFTASDLVVLLRDLATGNTTDLGGHGALHGIAWSTGLEALLAPHARHAAIVSLAKTSEGPLGDALRWTLARHGVLPASAVSAPVFDESARLWPLTHAFHGAGSLAPEREWARKVIEMAVSPRGFASAESLGPMLEHATVSERIELGMRCYKPSEGRRALVAIGRANALQILDAADPAARAVFATPNDAHLVRRALIAWLALFDLTDHQGFGPFEQWIGFLGHVEASLDAVCSYDREEIEVVRAAISEARRAAST